MMPAEECTDLSNCCSSVEEGKHRCFIFLCLDVTKGYHIPSANTIKLFPDLGHKRASLNRFPVLGPTA